MFRPCTHSILDSFSKYCGRFKRPLFFLTIFLFMFSCEEDKKYSASELWNLGTKIDPNIQLVPMTNPESRVTCQQYGQGCVPMSPKRIKLRMVDLVAVQFDSTKNAREEAMKIGQFYARNWVFDDVKGEPVLEDFVIKAFQAKDGTKEKVSE